MQTSTLKHLRVVALVLLLTTAPTLIKSLLNILVIKALKICNIAVKSSMSIFGVALNWAMPKIDTLDLTAILQISRQNCS